MNKFKMPLLGLALLLCTSLQAQVDFSNCAAILLNAKLVVDEYSPAGTCRISAHAKGKFTVQPITMDDKGNTLPQGKRRFKVAIRDGNTKTLLSFSDKIYTEIALEDLLKACRKGDHLVFMTLDRDLALPHNEVLVE
jgi:hypothetical protein